MEVRESLDISQLEGVYEIDTASRMGNFAALNADALTVTSIDYAGWEAAEMEARISAYLSQDWVTLSASAVYDAFGWDFWNVSGIQLQNCKKYMVYSEHYQGGIALLMWYFEVYFAEADLVVELLVDSETDLIYYLEGSPGASWRHDAEEMGQEAYLDDGIIVSYHADYRLETLSVLAANFQSNLPYYADYYESDKEAWRESLGKELNYAQVWEANTAVDEQRCAVTFPLSYGELSLGFQFQAAYGGADLPVFSMGIQAIGKLMPEMIQK